MRVDFEIAVVQWACRTVSCDGTAMAISVCTLPHCISTSDILPYPHTETLREGRERKRKREAGRGRNRETERDIYNYNY